MPTLATVLELADYAGVQLAPDDPRAQLLLEVATGLIQAATDQFLFAVEDEAIELPGTWGPELWLPQRPVTAISSVAVNALTIAAGGYTFSSSGQLYRGPLPSGNGPDWDDEFDSTDASGWGGPRSVVAITYSHGYAVIPSDLRAICLEVAARGLNNPEGLQSETIGGYSYTRESGASAGQSLSDDQSAVCKRYRYEPVNIAVGVER